VRQVRSRLRRRFLMMSKTSLGLVIRKVAASTRTMPLKTAQMGVSNDITKAKAGIARAISRRNGARSKSMMKSLRFEAMAVVVKPHGVSIQLRIRHRLDLQDDDNALRFEDYILHVKWPK